MRKQAFSTISKGDRLLPHTPMLSSSRSLLFQLHMGDRIFCNYY
ncbi:MAG: hypothetical protein AAGD25_07460 [Cyanobacteria bacterium P01_F01_bin.150]